MLMCLKIQYKDQVTLIRGNHESRQISQVYGLYDECKRKYSNTLVWRYFVDVFDCLPISAIVND